MTHVAERALVSLATVDWVLYGRPGVCAPTVFGVMAAVSESGYAFVASEVPVSQAYQLNILFVLSGAANFFLHQFGEDVVISQDSWMPFGVNSRAAGLEPHPSLSGIDRIGGGVKGVLLGLQIAMVDHKVIFLAQGLSPAVRSALICGRHRCVCLSNGDQIYWQLRAHFYQFARRQRSHPRRMARGCERD